MSEQLIIAGFHRSGTSATAQLLDRAGLFLGYELLEPLPSNPYGHFEDREVVSLHQGILADNELTWVVEKPFLPVVGESRWERMRKLIEHRNTEHALWGFKDPRVCMFMALWKYLLPGMKALLVYRHFSDSTYSLAQRHASDLFLNRGSSYVHRQFFEEPDLALRMWLFHNRALLAFARAHPEDTLVVSMDMIRDGFPVVWAIEQRWNLGLRDMPPAEVYDPKVTCRGERRQPVSDRSLIEKVLTTWRELEEMSRNTEAMLVSNREAAIVGK